MFHILKRIILYFLNLFYFVITTGSYSFYLILILFILF